MAAGALALAAAACSPGGSPPGSGVTATPSPAAEGVEAKAAGAGTATSSGAAREPAVAAVDGYLDGLEGIGFAGGALVARGGEVLLSRGMGLANREAGTPWTTETVFSLGSITKPFTASAILLLAERGDLDLDDTLGSFFPEAPASHASIPVSSLLTHTSGLPDFDQRAYKDTDPVTRDQMIAIAMGSGLLGPPGSRYRYSNLGYSLLGAIIEIVSGKTYEAFLREALLLPAGAAGTGYRLAEWDDTRLAVGYRRGRRWGTITERLPEGKPPWWVLRANGGLHTTLGDAHRLVEATLGGGVLSAGSVDLLSSSAHEITGGIGQAAGWIVDRTGDRLELRHAGGNEVFSAEIRHYPGSGLTIIVASGLSELGASEPAVAVSRILHGGSAPTLRPVPGRRAVVGAHEALAGGWIFPEGGFLRIKDLGDFLEVSVQGDALIGGFLELDTGARSELDSIQARARATVEALLADRDPDGSPAISSDLRSLWSRLAGDLEPSGIRYLGTAPVWYASSYASWIRLGSGPEARIRRLHWNDEGEYAALGGSAYPAPLTLLCIPAPEGKCLTRHVLLPARSFTVRRHGEELVLEPDSGAPILRGRPAGAAP